MLHFLTDIQHAAFELLGYPMSYLELFGTLTGLITVWLAARANILTWPTGLINNVAFFLLFHQVRLYSDMFLQVYFFIVSLYGWWNWRGTQSKARQLITLLTNRQRIVLGVVVIFAIGLLGYGMSGIHLYFPRPFPQPASYPYADAFTAVMSIVATMVMANKKLECWLCWILVDVVSIGLYAIKGIHLIALEYAVFLVICAVGLFQWIKLYSHANRPGTREVYAHPQRTP